MNTVSPSLTVFLKDTLSLLMAAVEGLRWGRCYLTDGGHHVLVFLSAEEFLHAEVKLLQQLLVSWQAQ